MLAEAIARLTGERVSRRAPAAPTPACTHSPRSPPSARRPRSPPPISTAHSTAACPPASASSPRSGPAQLPCPPQRPRAKPTNTASSPRRTASRPASPAPRPHLPAHPRPVRLALPLAALARRPDRPPPHILGTHDFTSFAASDPDLSTRTTRGRPHPARRRTTTHLAPAASKSIPSKPSLSAEWHAATDLLIYRVTATGFLHHMVRNIVGTFVQIGRGIAPPSDLAPSSPPATAPPPALPHPPAASFWSKSSITRLSDPDIRVHS